MSGSEPRRGVHPVLIALPPGPSIEERLWRALSEKGADISLAAVRAALDRGDAGLLGESRAFVHRPVPDEADIDLPVVLETDRILIIDKPHGIAATPQGAFVARSVLVQARRRFGDDVACAHRLDRATAGLMLLVRHPRFRGVYQSLFERRRVEKTYRFIAPLGAIPPIRSSRLVQRGTSVTEVPGEPNAVTEFRMIESRGEWAHYEARPLTGQMHQIRAHAAALDIPILGDTLYGPGEGFPDRIELLALGLEFTDPVDGTPVVARSRRSLAFPDI